MDRNFHQINVRRHSKTKPIFDEENDIETMKDYNGEISPSRFNMQNQRIEL
jgi:hypothetical protein